MARRRALSDAPDVLPLRHYLDGLARPGCAVPLPDPLDGGAAARLLFLLEKPSPAAVGGFVSRDNTSSTARAIKAFMLSAGIPRGETLLWNAVPWWNGTARVTAAELAAGAQTLPVLIAALSRLACVVTVGRRAADVWRRGGDARLATFATAHPSPQVKAAHHARWEAIPAVWKSAYQAALHQAD